MPDSFSLDSLRRIRRLAFVVRALCLIGVLVIGTMPFLFWAQPEWVAEVVTQQWAISKIQLDLYARLGGLAGSAVPASVSLFALWQMWALFGCFAQGDWVVQLVRCTVCLIGRQMVSFLFYDSMEHRMETSARAVIRLRALGEGGGLEVDMHPEDPNRRFEYWLPVVGAR